MFGNTLRVVTELFILEDTGKISSPLSDRSHSESPGSQWSVAPLSVLGPNN